MKKAGTIILSPPWPRTGTGNIVAAQSFAHSERGEDVFLLLEPLGPWHSKYNRSAWDNIMHGMMLKGVNVVGYPRVGKFDLLTKIKWLAGNKYDAITAVARYAASGKLPESISRFVSSHNISIIRVNHVFGMILTDKILKLVLRTQESRPTVILNTHDIQSDVFANEKRQNKISGLIDSKTNMLRGEIGLASKADVLIHISKRDFDFFSARLPKETHTLILPTLDPVVEQKLLRSRSKIENYKCDFIYLGNNNEGNLKAVKWLLSAVLPKFKNRPPVIKIVGTIKSLFECREPELFAQYRHLFVGEIPSVLSAYKSARAVLAPAMVGTGASIKLTEALCAGKPIITTTVGMRGIPREAKIGAGLIVEDDPRKFSEAMLSMMKRRSAFLKDNVRLYDKYFSSKVFAKAFGEVLLALERK